ncbi:hypothetical protein B14911_12252 [Bacillus sp. NRRL B-14911]|uniref:Uncharacterized protein n=2 Tax=Bacillus infantis TaxID=324767 RepID=U5LCF7_9BACI|nr:hypothetical protein N288_11695 [Bacillus infantis NRRL B-14911]EAR66091.1 hypothetical protein B14911_12252 [Bacillus sp. NRRL B-14911]OXT15926.1 hypothetical protein B9K06_18345 [Bacillus sp. OG2]
MLAFFCGLFPLIYFSNGGNVIMETIEIGSFNLKVDLLVSLLSLLIVHLFFFFHLKNRQEFRKTFEDKLFTAVLIWFLLYKFGRLLFQPSLLWTNPLGLLYFNGGIKEAILGLLGAALYFTGQCRKQGWAAREMVYLVIYALFTFLCGFWLLSILYIFIK